MSEIKELLEKIVKRQSTVSDLIKFGEISIKANGQHRLKFEEEIDFITVFNNENCSISIVDFPNEGQEYPKHLHEGIVEYLICLKGSFGIRLPHNGYRILNAKECAKIPCDTTHSVISLESNGQMIGICLPAEPAYIKQVEKGDLK